MSRVARLNGHHETFASTGMTRPHRARLHVAQARRLGLDEAAATLGSRLGVGGVSRRCRCTPRRLERRRQAPSTSSSCRRFVAAWMPVSAVCTAVVIAAATVATSAALSISSPTSSLTSSKV